MVNRVAAIAQLPAIDAPSLSLRMRRRRASIFVWFVCILGWLVALPALAEERFPWAFDMTTDEVKGIEEFGPYKAFSNGDLETFNGIYDGQKENFQFFFRDGKLWRIGIYLYEGKDISAGADAWLSLYQSLIKRFGPIETRGNTAPGEGDSESNDLFARKAADIVRSTGKTQMAPLHQPGDAFVFASFKRNVIAADTYYVLTLYLNRDRE